MHLVLCISFYTTYFGFVTEFMTVCHCLISTGMEGFYRMQALLAPQCINKLLYTYDDHFEDQI